MNRLVLLKNHMGLSSKKYIFECCEIRAGSTYGYFNLYFTKLQDIGISKGRNRVYTRNECIEILIKNKRTIFI